MAEDLAAELAAQGTKLYLDDLADLPLDQRNAVIAVMMTDDDPSEYIVRMMMAEAQAKD